MNRIAIETSINEKARLSFSHAGGPGGQNVNKVATKVEARIRIEEVEGLSDFERSTAIRALGPRLSTEGELIVYSRIHRTQGANRKAAIDRLVLLILEAARPRPPRVATKPTKASITRRLDEKRKRGIRKANRGSFNPRNDD